MLERGAGSVWGSGGLWTDTEAAPPLTLSMAVPRAARSGRPPTGARHLPQIKRPPFEAGHSAARAPRGGRGWGLVVPPRLARTAHHPVWPHWPTQCVGHASEDAGAPFGCMLVPRPCTRLAGGPYKSVEMGSVVVPDLRPSVLVPSQRIPSHPGRGYLRSSRGMTNSCLKSPLTQGEYDT